MATLTNLITVKETSLTQVKPPVLPLAPVEYQQKYADDTNNILRLYFSQINTLISQLKLDTTATLQIPYGAFQDTTTQTIVANTATVMKFNQTDFSSNVSMVSGSKITVAKAGIYNLQWSGEFQNSDNAIHDINIWLRQDGPGAGIDIPGSKGVISVPARKSAAAGEEAHNIYGWNYFVSLNDNEFVELWWSTDSALVTLKAFPVTTTPVVTPSTASVVATMTFVSALPA